jgi:archaemetzincin
VERTLVDASASGPAAATPWREIALAAIETESPQDARLVAAVASELSRRVRLPCRLVAAPAGPAPAPVPGRPQLDADRLLAGLEAVAADGVPLVGVTAADLGLPLFTFVFGRARLGGRAVVVSLARLRPERYGLPADGALVARRAVVEILHELGHLAGLAHCADSACLMNFATSVEAADLRGSSFCASCAAALPAGVVRPAPAAIPRP